MQKIRWIAIIRDVIIISFLTALGGIVIGLSAKSHETDISMMAVAISNFALGSIAFCISGCLTKVNRWQHLALVAFIIWLIGIVNVVTGRAQIQLWLLSFLPILVMMVIGGALSMLFVKEPPKTPLV